MAAIKIIACTGHGSAGEQSAALAAGCDEILVKPAAPQAVAAAVRRHLGIAEPEGAEKRRFSRRR
jgi:DNA-binding response OmpR family regulator